MNIQHVWNLGYKKHILSVEFADEAEHKSFEEAWLRIFPDRDVLIVGSHGWSAPHNAEAEQYAEGTADSSADLPETNWSKTVVRKGRKR